MGSMMEAVAALEATSVTAAAIRHTMSMVANGGIALSTDSCSPSHCDSPDTLHASESAKPAP